MADGRSWPFQHVSIGNPQCAIDVGAELESLDLAAIGPEIENSHELFPNRTNVSFYRDRRRSGPRADLRARGGGDPLLGHRGSGAAVAAILAGAPAKLVLVLDGGELEVEIGEDLAVRLTGWAEPIYAGELSPQLLRALEGLG